MSKPSYRTMGQQFGRRSWAEPWKIKMVEPIHMTTHAERQAAESSQAMLSRFVPLRLTFIPPGASKPWLGTRGWHKRAQILV